MLDTSAVSYALRGVGEVGAAIRQRHPSQLCVSAITVTELRYGVEKRRSKKLATAVDAFIAGIAVEPFDADAAGTYARIMIQLEASGQTIGTFDTMIAAHALSLGITLVTHNAKHFKRVKGLLCDDWT